MAEREIKTGMLKKEGMLQVNYESVCVNPAAHRPANESVLSSDVN